MDFETRLKQAIDRGSRAGRDLASMRARGALTEEELRRLHGQFRLQLCDQIEGCLRSIESHFPGFRFETIVGERGWGAGLSRDDVQIVRGKNLGNAFSRYELIVRPYSSLHVLELAGKGTVRNKEIFHRSHFATLEETEIERFLELVDAWSLEYAEAFAKGT